uniref:G-protein coupled receptors family 1 profile domain-containing protein n=1 Tax=Strongyloides stercoralis TaxID=6248 RepID=A0A0K0E813_STRER
MDTYIFCSHIGNLIFGVFFNSIAIYITFKMSSEKYISQINSLIVIQFIFGLITSILSSSIGMTLFVYNDYLIVVFLFLNWIPYNFILHRVILLITTILLYVTITFPIGILVTRCMILCKHWKLKRVKLFIITVCCFIAASLVGHNSYLLLNKELPRNTFKEFLNNSSLKSTTFLEENVALGTNISLENWKFGLIESVIYILLTSLTIFLSMYKYIKHMKSLSSSMSPVTKKLHTDFVKIVLIQSILPFFIIFPTIMLYCGFILICKFQRNFYLGDIILKLFCAVPTINAILYIFLPKNNRMNFFLIFSNLMNIMSCNSNNESEKFDVPNQANISAKSIFRRGSRNLNCQNHIHGRVRALSIAYIE